MKDKYKVMILVLLIVIAMGSVAYGAFIVVRSQSVDNTITAGCFLTTFSEGGNGSIRLSSALPTSNNEAIMTNATYDFTVNNTCSDTDADYYVLLNVGNTSFSDNYVSYQYDGGVAKILSTATANTSFTIDDGYTNSYLIGSGTIVKGHSKDFKLNIWLNDSPEYTDFETNKSWNGKIKVVTMASQKYVNYMKTQEHTVSNGVVSVNNIFGNTTLARNTVDTISFVNSSAVPNDAIASWDVSVNQNKSVMAWYKASVNNGYYTLYIGQDGGVKANSDASAYFANYTSLKSITGLNNLDFGQTTNMSSLFNGCSSLTGISLDNFDISLVTDMSYMFYGASSLVNLDLSSFDMSGITNTSDMLTSMNSLETLITPKKYPTLNSLMITLPKTMYDNSGREYMSIGTGSPLASTLTSTVE